jgi:hypothetical protein
MWFLKILLLATFAFIFYQDFKTRLVYWYWYLFAAILCFFIQSNYATFFSSIINTIINLLFIGAILMISFLYSRFKLKQPFLKEVFGLGDVLFFLAICCSFSPASFLILFVFSLLFSLLMHLLLVNKNKEATVPLAGYMALFFGVVYIISFICDCGFLYSY